MKLCFWLVIMLIQIRQRWWNCPSNRLSSKICGLARRSLADRTSNSMCQRVISVCSIWKSNWSIHKHRGCCKTRNFTIALILLFEHWNHLQTSMSVYNVDVFISLLKCLDWGSCPEWGKGSEGAVRTKPRVSGLKDRAALGINHKSSLKLWKSDRKIRLNKPYSVAPSGLYVILFIYSRGCAVFSDRLPRALIFSPFRAVYLQVLQQPLFLFGRHWQPGILQQKCRFFCSTDWLFLSGLPFIP